MDDHLYTGDLLNANFKTWPVSIIFFGDCTTRADVALSCRETQAGTRLIRGAGVAATLAQNAGLSGPLSRKVAAFR